MLKIQRGNLRKRFWSILEKGKKITIIDLGAGINGLSYSFFEKINKKVKYLGIEAIGQLVKVMNNYFKKR